MKLIAGHNMERKIPVSMSRVVRVCDNCEKGSMEFQNTQTTLAVYPVRYGHKCDKCGYVDYYETIYPFLAAEPLTQDIQPLVEPTGMC